MAEDPVAEARRTVESTMPVEVARALGAFRAELASYDDIDADEAADYGDTYLNHLLAAWLPLPPEAYEATE